MLTASLNDPFLPPIPIECRFTSTPCADIKRYLPMNICTFFRVILLVFNSPCTKLFHEQIFEINIVFRREVVAGQCDMQFLMLTKFLHISECRASSRF